MLPMLTVTGTPGLVYLNGRFCGETGAAALPLAREGVQYLELRPFAPDAQGAVLRLKVAGGKLVEGVQGDAFAVQWPGGWIALELRGKDSGADLPEAEPSLLSSLAMPDGHYLFVNEGGVPSFGRDAEEAVFLPLEAVLEGSLRPLDLPGLCAAEGDCAEGRFAAILRAQGRPEILHCAAGLTAQVDGMGTLRCVQGTGDTVGHATLSVWAPNGQGQVALCSREAVWQFGAPRWPQTPQETAKAWLEALHFGAGDEATGYLLLPEHAQRFIRIAGAFDTVVDLPPDGGEGIRQGVAQLEGENLLSVRQLDFTLARQASVQGNWKIESISEGLCD